MPHPIGVPSEIVRKWQEIVDLLAEIMRVPSARDFARIALIGWKLRRFPARVVAAGLGWT
jgi:hypothetical protein